MLHLPQQVLLVINVASRKTGITNERNAPGISCQL